METVNSISDEPVIDSDGSAAPSPQRVRLSRAVALVVLSPAVLALSGCSSRNCDSNYSTPTTTDDCSIGRSGSSSSYYRGGSRARGNSYGSTRGGFGGFGRMFGGFGS